MAAIAEPASVSKEEITEEDATQISTIAYQLILPGFEELMLPSDD